MSSRSSSVVKKNKYEKIFLEFLLKRLKNCGGCLHIEKISGHFSQLSSDVRSAIGTSKYDILCFLKRHSTIFSIENDIIQIVDSSRNGSYDSDCSSIDPQSELPLRINKGKGVIIKIFPGFGFIKAKEPVKTVVYFTSLSYGNKDFDLTSSLYVGAMVYFHADKKKDDSRSKYSATKVWKVDESDIHSNIVVRKSRKNRDSGLYDPMTLDSEGIIQNVFPNLGFIAVKGDENNTVFFHKNRLLKYDNLVDLTKVLSKGDIVEFSAHRSTKQDAKARWEATKVWKKSSQIKETCDTESDKSLGNHSSVSKVDMKSKRNTKEMIRNQRGKICPRSQGAVIKFGQNELADGDGSVYYISGCEVKEISWEFSEGDNVFFDAVKIKSAPGWKAVLVWVGEKPDIVLPTCLGDFSEFTDDETEDNLSSYVSFSSNSSAKSECSSFKNRKMKKDTSSNVSNFSDHREDKRNNSKQKFNNSFSRNSSQSNLSITSKSSQKSKSKHKDEDYNKYLVDKNEVVSSWGDSPCPAGFNHSLSRNSSQSNLSITSKSSQKSKSKHKDEDYNKYLGDKNEAVSSWGDSPCPADDDFNNISSDTYECNLALKSKSSQKSNTKHKDEDYNKYLGNKNKAVSSWGDSPCPADDDYNNISSDTYESNLALKSNNKVSKVPTKEIQSMERLGTSVEEKLGNIKNELCSLEEIKKEKYVIPKFKDKETSYIKKFTCIEGKIIKVYLKFADVKAKEIGDSFSFFWNNFYIKGVSVEELELDNLKQVLKIGDTIHFNYFEIVDDSGQKWQKVSLAWKDSKPAKVTEITPEDFIKQNNLSVTNKTAPADIAEDNIVCKKYLTAVQDLDADELVNNTSSESCDEDISEAKSLMSADQSDVSERPNKILSSQDYKMISSVLIKILKEKDLFLPDSEVNMELEESSMVGTQPYQAISKIDHFVNLVDFNSIAEEIVNVVLENHDPRKCNSKFCQPSQKENYTNMTSNTACAACGEVFVLNSDKGVNTKNSEVQTIITGEVIAQNIFTEC